MIYALFLSLKIRIWERFTLTPIYVIYSPCEADLAFFFNLLIKRGSVCVCVYFLEKIYMLLE